MHNKLIAILFAVLLGLPLLPAFFAGQQASEAQDQRRSCLQDVSANELLAGKLRLGGSGYYLVTQERWHFLTMRCNPSASRHGCAGASPTQQALEKNLGAEIRARLCHGEIASVEIGGIWYAR